MSLEKTSAEIPWRPMFVAGIAVALESYDLAVYALFAVTLSGVFFSAESPGMALLMTAATLGVGYISRPLGGIVLGAFADKRGRKLALAVTVATMSVSTGAIGLIPTYDQIGLLAPALVVIARLVQGFAAGGAVASGVSYLTESAPDNRRGFFASWQQSAQMCAYLLATLLGVLMTTLVPDLNAYGGIWRIPFLLALVFGPLGLYIKRKLPEARAYSEQTEAERKLPLGAAVGSQWRKILAGFSLSALWNVSAFVLLFFMPAYAQKEFGIAPGTTFASSLSGAALMILMCPLIGLASDRVGRKGLMLVGSVGLLLLCYPLLAWLAHSPQASTLYMVQLAFGALMAFYTAPVPAMLSELFPTHTRSTGLSIAYNLSTLILGSFGPLIVTWMIMATGIVEAPAFYVMAAAALSSTVLLLLRDRTGEHLDAT